jgi:hypothetical protein
LIYPPMAKSTISMSIDSDNFPIKGYQRVQHRNAGKDMFRWLCFHV